MSSEQIQADVKANMVKEGMLNHLKEKKERWVVLTKSHIYTF
jgi:hypothetical protein